MHRQATRPRHLAIAGTAPSAGHRPAVVQAGPAEDGLAVVICCGRRSFLFDDDDRDLADAMVHTHLDSAGYTGRVEVTSEIDGQTWWVARDPVHPMSSVWRLAA